MATLQPRGKRWRTIVRRKGQAAQTKTFLTKDRGQDLGRPNRARPAQRAAAAGRTGDIYDKRDVATWWDIQREA